ncbi:hypothetical protein ACIRPK_32070 [Kitasatospora sp. NPDC101801]|uniref:RipA family octameric membrane protein n=1 Tax=Kitasatospora sp. NPDC101801 TaxID=3364103 RepID=UPI0037F23AAC
MVGSLAVTLAGAALSAGWWLRLRSCQDLNGAKYKVIHERGKTLSVSVFADEWKHLKGPLDQFLGKRYAELGLSGWAMRDGSGRCRCAEW